MEVNREFVQQFNEKNILKQDIIKTIYSKFYNKNDIIQNINRLKPLGENIRLTDNKFEFDVHTDKEQYVFMSIPYSKGWTATVNGQKATLLKADLAFMALRLPIGQHKVELTYHTPYLRLGGLISLLSSLLLGSLCYITRRRRAGAIPAVNS